MNITIKRNIAQELDCFKIKQKLLLKPVKPAIVLLIIDIVLIWVCQNDFGVTQTSIGCYVFFEIFLLVIAYSFLKAAYQRQKIYKDFSKTALQQYAAIETYSTISIDDDYFIYESVRKYYKLSWSSLGMYQLYNNNLVLMIDNYNNSFIIKPDEISREDYQELHSIASKKLKLRKK